MQFPARSPLVFVTAALCTQAFIVARKIEGVLAINFVHRTRRDQNARSFWSTRLIAILMLDNKSFNAHLFPMVNFRK